MLSCKDRKKLLIYVKHRLKGKVLSKREILYCSLTKTKVNGEKKIGGTGTEDDGHRIPNAVKQRCRNSGLHGL